MKTSELSADGEDVDHISFIIGLALAVSSSVFIGSSFIIKKIALRRLAASGGLRASAGGFAYLRQGLWWLGFLTMGVGEAANLLAYAWAPAALVTPLGALSVLVAATLAHFVLGEHLGTLARMACALCVVGSVVLVLHAPHGEHAGSFEELLARLRAPVFLTFMAGAGLLALAVRVLLVRRYGERHVAVYLLLCSAVGSLTVVFCKAAALGARQAAAGDRTVLRGAAFWLLLLAAAFCVCIQMNYLNRSLDVFSAGLVTPVYYVMFTLLVVLGSALLFEEWRRMTAQDALGAACGFVVVVIAVFLLNMFRDASSVHRRQSRTFADTDVSTEHGLYMNGSLRNNRSS